MEAEESVNLWDALAGTPAEAANLTARPELMTALCERVRSWA